ncbi:methyltransferase [Brevibacillus sp. B_LB10_24]|uniref:methyltransferase n=1 Tax=Brevibacillus sp. B_LB10_24 TaxID=3380645 RepID=UPI0038BDB610
MKHWYLGLCLAIFSLGFLQACANSSGDAQTTLYENTSYHFTLQLPASWEGKYDVDETDSAITFSSTANKPGGVLLQIGIWTKEKWKEEGEELTQIIHIAKIGETEDKIFSFSTPTDVQYIPDDEAKKQEYLRMTEDIEKIKASFEIKK